jgi:serine protease Do
MMRKNLRKIQPQHIILSLLLVIAFLTGALVVSLAPPETYATTELVAKKSAPYNPYAIADIAEEVGPAVVYIETTYKPKTQERTNPFGDSFFREFFGDFFPFQEPPQPGQGVGSGFIISPDGFTITNYHVVEGADEIKVTIQGKDKYKAELKWADANLDLAILKIADAKDLPVARMGDSDQTRVGEWVVAIGNPYQLDHTVTTGVLSAKGREIKIPDSQGRVRTYPNLMQTDAAINPGNSGGPLLNLSGEVIGINTAVNAQAQGIGFAIPINTIKDIVTQLLDTGKVSRPYLGIYYQGLDEQLAQYLDLPDTNGVIIRSVMKDSAADKAGLKVGDVIREINRKKIKDIDDLQKIINKLKVGDEATFLVVREGKLQTVKVKIGEKPQITN